MKNVTLSRDAVRPAHLDVQLPPRSPVLYRFFLRVARHELRQNFHCVRLLRTGKPRSAHARVVFANHPSWWDPLILIFLADQFFPQHHAYGPIDSDSLARYRIFSRLGFFGIEPSSRRGAIDFLQTVQAILSQADTMIWMTPQGHFRDERVRPTALQRGLGHLAARSPEIDFLPLAIELDFWSEKRAEILLAFGPPVSNTTTRDPDHLTINFERALEETQNRLTAAAQRRAGEEWEILLTGKVGASPVYDAWRRFRSRLHGKAFSVAHDES